jgi:hypothetical protein
MNRNVLVRPVIFSAVAAALFVTGTATSQPRPATSQSQPPSRPRPKLEPVAETKLLMEGLMQSNFRGLERNLKQRPADDTAWVYARGQALLMAETGNLLLLRPPKSGGQDAWQELSIDLREKATRLARLAATKDLDGSRIALADLAVSCNRCHQTFGQQTRIVPFADGQ